jgi:predicted outer membrane repeat protein
MKLSRAFTLKFAGFNLIAAVIALAFVAASAPGAQAATCTVTNANNSGSGSLRENIANATCDTINFAGDYTIPLASTLTIGRNVTIDGAGHTVTVSGGSAVRVFTVNSSVTFNLQNITVANGHTDYGGGIFTNSSSNVVNLTNVTLSGNSATQGGAIYIYTGNITLTNVTFSGNSATSYGGGMNSTFSGVTLTNVTFSGNTAGGVGGGMYTVTDNVTMRNSILWGNSGWQIGGSSSTFSITNSVISTGCPSGGTCTNVSTADPKLGALGNYGGGMQTFPLLPGSAAIDAGDPTTCANTPVNNLDQRGQARDDLQCDIGAFELKFTDSPTVIRPISSTVTTTFGPALMGLRRDAGFTDPGIITVTKEAWSRQGLESIGVLWAISPTVTNGFSLTLQLCYTPTELGSLTESNLRLWRSNGVTWTKIITAPTLSVVNGITCTTVSGITALSRWTLATDTPTAVMLRDLAATCCPSPVMIGALDAALASLAALGAVLVGRRRRVKQT